VAVVSGARHEPTACRRRRVIYQTAIGSGKTTPNSNPAASLGERGSVAKKDRHRHNAYGGEVFETDRGGEADALLSPLKS